VTTAQLTEPRVSAVYDAAAGAVAPCLPFLRRILKHPRLKHYNRLVAMVMTVNRG
jgi:hypothetical protein